MPTTETKAIRWLIRRDLPEVLDIERRAHKLAWTEEDFLCCLRQRNSLGMVAETPSFNRNCHRIFGFMFYELHRGRLNILRLAVHPEDRRCGIGAAMVTRLKEKLSQQRRRQITFMVREDNLDGQLFLKSQGFHCNATVREHFDDWTNGYEFVFELSEPTPGQREEVSPAAFEPKTITEPDYRVVECLCGWTGKRKAWLAKPCPKCGEIPEVL